MDGEIAANRETTQSQLPKYPWGPIHVSVSQGTFNCLVLGMLIYLGLICHLATQRRNRKEFMPRHFWFAGLHQHHFLYASIGSKSLENMKSYIVYRESGLLSYYNQLMISL